MSWPHADLVALAPHVTQTVDYIVHPDGSWEIMDSSPQGTIESVVQGGSSENSHQTRLFPLPPSPKPNRWKVEWRWKHPKEGRTGDWHPIWESGAGYRTRREAVNTVNRNRRGMFARERDHRIVGFSTVKHLEFHYEGGGDIDAF